MPHYIIKLEDKYLTWSTIVDAPTTFGATRENYLDWIREEYGADGVRKTIPRLNRADETGVSSPHFANVDELIAGNRAGPNESELTKEEIVEWYVRRCEEPK